MSFYLKFFGKAFHLRIWTQWWAALRILSSNTTTLNSKRWLWWLILSSGNVLNLNCNHRYRRYWLVENARSKPRRSSRAWEGMLICYVAIGPSVFFTDVQWCSLGRGNTIRKEEEEKKQNGLHTVDTFYTSSKTTLQPLCRVDAI